MYKYKYKKIDDVWSVVRNHKDFHSVCFPPEIDLTETILAQYNIVRYDATTPIDIKDAKVLKIKELQNSRDFEERMPIYTEKGNFDADDISQSRMRNAMDNLANAKETREWTTINGEAVTMKRADFQAIFSAIVIRGDNAFAHLNELIGKVNECTTVEEVQEIRWENRVE